ncbi:solute symporter family protein [Pseudonocardia sp. HH130630-07]|uniref:solute symporter family protein n=1 Tax=Pseudonocardia sp. HH130630-07 TaxID=1690815 RepID=UPI000814C078|nr:cation acetate symporter [Pseudonocardia sp. HH130630-07]ANY07990.1 cation acetate symporter [Pseudonocardia sp. HH130630-07]
MSTVGSPILNMAVFGLFVILTLGIVYRVSHRNATPDDYYAAGGGFTGAQNGIAMSGDFLSAASFLGISGAIAVYGFDGFVYSVSWVVAWLVALLLVGEGLRNTGRFTMGDVMAFRLQQSPVRAAAATSTLVISLVYMVAQMAGAGGLVALLLGIHGGAGQSLLIIGVGVVMMLYVLVGGMRGTTWVQIIKAVGLLICVALLAMFVLGRFGLSMSALLDKAAETSPMGSAVLEPGGWYSGGFSSRLDFVSLGLALVLGISSLPHVLMRFFTVPNAKEARRSVTWCSWLMVGFYLCILVVGFGAAAVVGPEEIMAAPGAANSAAPLLAYRIGGTPILGLVSAVAFATILAVVAGLTLTASASFAHDVYASIIRRGKAEPRSEIRVARTTAVVIGALSIAGGVLARDVNVAFLVSLALAIAASANLPTIVFALFWPRFSTRGALWSIYTGLIGSIVLICSSTTVSGTPSSLLPDVDMAWFPLTNPAIVTVPLSFLAAILGTLLGKPADPGLARAMEVRALTGIDARG